MQPPLGYCVACKAKREITDAKEIERAGGPAIEGKCSVCGSTVFILGAQVQVPVRQDGARPN